MSTPVASSLPTLTPSGGAFLAGPWPTEPTRSRLWSRLQARLDPRPEPLTALERQLSVRRGDQPIVLGSVAAPLQAIETMPALVARLRSVPSLDLRLVVGELRLDRDPDLLARLDEHHAITVEVVVPSVEATTGLLLASALAERGLVVRIVTPIDATTAVSSLDALGPALRELGVVDWRLAGRPSGEVEVAHRLWLLRLGLGQAPSRT